MTLNKAIERLYWRIETGMPKANQNDLDALNTIVDAINESQQRTIKENIPFTKMYAYLFGVFLDKYKDVYLAQNELNRILDTPTLRIYEMFFEKLNFLEFINFCEFNDITLKHPATDTEDERQKNKEIIAENQEQLAKLAFGLRNFDEVRESLNTQISCAFNKYQLKQ